MRIYRHYRGGSGIVFVVLWGVSAGCSFLPGPPPLLPEPERRFGVAVSVGRMYVPSRAEVASPETGAVRLRQTWDGEAGPGVPALFDPRISLTWVASDRALAAVHASLLSNGIELRHLTRALGPDTPLFVSVGGQTDGPIFIGARGWPGFAWEARAGVGLQPSLGTRLRLLLGAAASFGPRRRALLAPDESIGRNEADNIYPAELRILRPELQAEALVGASLRLGSAVRVAVAVQPFHVVTSGKPRSACFMCVDGVQLISYHSTWGLALWLSAAPAR